MSAVPNLGAGLRQSGATGGWAVRVNERYRADAVFEGGGVKGLAFAAAIASAERDAGVKEWVNIAGTPTDAIVASLLVACKQD